MTQPKYEEILYRNAYIVGKYNRERQDNTKMEKIRYKIFVNPYQQFHTCTWLVDEYFIHKILEIQTHKTGYILTL